MYPQNGMRGVPTDVRTLCQIRFKLRSVKYGAKVTSAKVEVSEYESEG